MLIGITGTIGSGKSFVAGLLGEMLQAPVHSSDEICRRLLERGEAGYQQVIVKWGNDYLNDSGEIDRVLLREAVFDEPKVRTALEAILHPLVRRELIDARDGSAPGVAQIAEVPLLFESGWQDDFDYIICVIADADIALQRVVERDSVKPEEVEKIFAVQMDSNLKQGRSDRVIDNSGTKAETVAQVEKLVVELRAMIVSKGSN